MQNLFENILLFVSGIGVGYIGKPLIDALISLIGSMFGKKE